VFNLPQAELCLQAEFQDTKAFIVKHVPTSKEYCSEISGGTQSSAKCELPSAECRVPKNAEDTINPCASAQPLFSLLLLS
jgi:hypothetical protein